MISDKLPIPSPQLNDKSWTPCANFNDKSWIQRQLAWEIFKAIKKGMKMYSEILLCSLWTALVTVFIPSVWRADREIMVYLGILVTRKYFGSQRILTENMTEVESVQLGNTYIADMDKWGNCCLDKCLDRELFQVLTKIKEMLQHETDWIQG